MIKAPRGDIGDSLFHLTRKRTVKPEATALDVLCEILSSGKIKGSNNSGFVKGHQTAACFTESPLSSLRYFAGLPDEDSKYELYGIAISKEQGFSNGARPALYLPDNEAEWIPDNQKWRHVRFEHGKIDWTHEREWRSKGDFDLSVLKGFYIVHWSVKEQETLKAKISPNISKLVRGYLPMEHLLKML